MHELNSRRYCMFACVNFYTVYERSIDHCMKKKRIKKVDAE